MIKLGEFVMGEAEIELVKQQTFSVNFPAVGAPMTIRTEGNEIVILMRLTLRPRDNVMNVNFDVSTTGNGAAVPGFDKDAPSEFSRYWSAPIPR